MLIGIVGCKNSVYDGRYCALVTYENSNTGTHSEYTHTVTVDENHLTKVDFPQGYLEDGDLPDANFSSDGKTSFNLPKGMKYSVKIIGRLG